MYYGGEVSVPLLFAMDLFAIFHSFMHIPQIPEYQYHAV